jgi:hypothetical protein
MTKRREFCSATAAVRRLRRNPSAAMLRRGNFDGKSTLSNLSARLQCLRVENEIDTFQVQIKDCIVNTENHSPKPNRLSLG